MSRGALAISRSGSGDGPARARLFAHFDIRSPTQAALYGAYLAWALPRGSNQEAIFRIRRKSERIDRPARDRLVLLLE